VKKGCPACRPAGIFLAAASNNRVVAAGHLSSFVRLVGEIGRSVGRRLASCRWRCMGRSDGRWRVCCRSVHLHARMPARMLDPARRSGRSGHEFSPAAAEEHSAARLHAGGMEWNHGKWTHLEAILGDCIPEHHGVCFTSST
jgi:hypothetical protein